MFLPNSLFEKPIFWGSTDFKYLGIRDDELVIENHKCDLAPVRKFTQTFLTENSQDVKEALEGKETDFLKIFYVNLVNLLRKTQSSGAKKPFQDGLRFFHILPSNPIEELAELAFEVIKKRVGWKKTECMDTIPPKIRKNLVFSNDSAKLAEVYKKYAYIRNYFSQDYSIVIHAQSTYLNIYTDLVKEIQKIQNPQNDLKSFKFLRNPVESEEYGNFAEFQEIKKEGRIDDTRDRNEIISADIYDENIEASESAFDYVRKNGNALNPTYVLNELLEELLDLYDLTSDQRALINDKIEIIKQGFGEQSQVGNLLVICIPKELAYSESSPLWLSAHHGIPLKTTGASFEQVGDFLQARKLKQAKKYLKFRGGLPVLSTPQCRLLAYLLKPDQGIKIFRVNALPKTFRKNYKTQIKEIAHEILSTQTY